jgi:RNA polymerase sigma-70 factor (ECF subfamily)
MRVHYVIHTVGQRGVRVTGTSEDEFDAFFRLACPQLVGQAYVYTGVLAQAQDLAHETLTRAWERWEQIRHYEDPGAWARRVLFNLATSEWRKTKIRRDEGTVPRPLEAPDVEAVALAQALTVLPVPQRHAIVLHDALGIPVAEIARDLEVPEGTVRSWLSRGRRVLAQELRIDDYDDHKEGTPDHG